MSEVSIIIVSYNTKELIKNCLSSIYEKTHDVDFEIFVVDNNSSDGSPEMIEQKFPNIKLIKNKDNKGFGAANNIAIKQSTSKYVFLLNPDTLLLNNAVKIFADYLEQNTQVGACGGKLFDKEMNLTNNAGHFPTLVEIVFKYGLRNLFKNFYRKKLQLSIIANENDELDYITGANLFLRKSMLDKVGLFDENFFMYFEETDLQYRIMKAGYEIKLCPNAEIIHLEGFDKNNFSRLKLCKKSEMYYFKKHYGQFHLLIIKILYFGLYFIQFLLKQNTNSIKIIKYIFNYRGLKNE